MSVSASLIIAVLYFTKTQAQSSEDHSSFGFNHPSTVNFNEIFSNSLSMLNDDALITVNKDDEFHLSNLPTQFVEFQYRTTSSTSTTTPPPKFLTAAYLNRETTYRKRRTTTKNETISQTATETTSTERPDERTIKVLPLENRGRGVLDLIFPATRVRGFKDVFETFRRMLSNTF